MGKPFTYHIRRVHNRAGARRDRSERERESGGVDTNFISPPRRAEKACGDYDYVRRRRHGGLGRARRQHPSRGGEQKALKNDGRAYVIKGKPAPAYTT